MPDIHIAGASRPFTTENAPVAKSIEGYVLIVTNLHPETTEDHLYDVFEEYSRVTNLHLNHDKLSGFVKGYAFIEFADADDAEEIMDQHKKKKFDVLGRTVEMDYAFVKPPNHTISASLFRRVGSSTVNRRLEGGNRDHSPSRP